MIMDENTKQTETYPRKDTNGRIYYACCVSVIGPPCQHVNGTREQ